MGIEFGNPYSERVYFFIDNANRLISYLVALALTAQLKKQHEQEKDFARKDYTTGLANQKGFYEAFTIEMARHRRENIPLSIAYLDCDNFKEVNDRFGHLFGDRALVAVCRALEDTFRATDLLVRLGGDEFVGILPDTDCDAASKAVERLLERARALRVEHASSSCGLTLSVGIAAFVDSGKAPQSEAETLLAEADRNLYAAKAAGRDRVVASAPVSRPGEA